jgi:predicted nucleotidyltransferase
MSDVFEIAEILISHAVRAHKDEVAIIAYYGSHARGLASPTSDLDIFYIPDEGKAGSLCSQFIIDGLPYDFWPVSWKFAEDIANARSERPWAVAASLIADAKVMYHRSQQDLDRFDALKARIAKLTRPESRRIMVERALDAFKNTLFQLGQMRFAADGDDVAGMRWAGRKFVNSAVNCLALVNQTYFTKGWGANLSQVLAMVQKPDGLEDLIRAIIMPQDTDRMLEEADRLAQEVREILRTAQASISEPDDAQDVFKDFYFFVFEYKNKVLAACERRDVIAAGYAAFLLQEEICQLMNKVENGFYGTDFNLLGEYSGGYEKADFPDLLESASQGDLVELARQVRRLDQKVREWFESHSIELNILDSEEELRRFLNHRDPV